jgi:addiction module HigA family antidote
MTIAQRIRAEAARHALTQAALAARLGISAQYVSDILSGRRSVSPFVAVRLERVLGMDAAAILQEQASEELEHARKELRA